MRPARGSDQKTTSNHRTIRTSRVIPEKRRVRNSLRIAPDDPSGIFHDTNLARVKELLKDYPFVAFHPGFIPHTLEAARDRRFALAHIDVDLYQSPRDAFAFFYPRVVLGGILVCDDYGAPAHIKSARRAVEEFFRDKPEKPIAPRTGQCFIIKTTP